jgi:ribose transport system substrate-binding protein
VVIAGIDGALAKQYQGIATIPIFDGTVAKVNEAVAGGVPFIAFIADSAEKSNRTVGMGQLAYDAGKSGGEFTKSFAVDSVVVRDEYARRHAHRT